MSTPTELTESEARSQFRGLLCGDCGGDVTCHYLHDATHRRGEPCVWTWIVVVRRELESRTVRWNAQRSEEKSNV